MNALQEAVALVRAAVLVRGLIAICAAASWLLSGCSGPLQCKRVPIVVDKHPIKPKPAGRVAVGCDGQVVLVIDADEVLP